MFLPEVLLHCIPRAPKVLAGNCFLFLQRLPESAERSPLGFHCRRSIQIIFLTQTHLQVLWRGEAPVFCPLEAEEESSPVSFAVPTTRLQQLHVLQRGGNPAAPSSSNPHRQWGQLLAMEKQWERDWGRGQMQWVVPDFFDKSHCLQGRARRWETGVGASPGSA